ncbi:hypothetical protein D9M68_830420 [compost metagenome]
MATPSLVVTGPMRGATKRGTAPWAKSAACTLMALWPSIPSATRIATFLALIEPSPGRASSDSAGDLVTSGLAGLSSARGMGGGICAMPRPSATCAASASDALRSEDTMRSRMAGTVTLDSSKRKAAAMCACSTALWLSKKSVAWV